MRRGLEEFADDVRLWRLGTPGRAPVYHRLLEEAAAMFQAPSGAVEEAARARVDAAWRERKAPSPYQRPLLLMAALRAEALRVGDRHPLYTAVAAAVTPDIRLEAATRAALADALADAPPRVVADLATRAVQTNETSRAVAWLWPAELAGCAGGRRPLALYDVGCSAGLNLAGDRLPPLWTDEAGAALALATDARIVARHGFDAQPLDVGRDADRLWLTACVWPGETARQDRLVAAMQAFAALAAGPAAPNIAMADLGDVPARLATLADQAAPGTVHLAYQTVVRDYLPEAVRARYSEGMRAWLTSARAGSPRVWIELEAPSPPVGQMTLEAHLAGPSGLLSLRLARCGYHPDRLIVDGDAVAAFVESHPGSRSAARG
jgi:hypothetical protein